MQHLTAEIVVEARFEHAEGPVWDARRGAVVWVDQYSGTAMAARPVPDERVEPFETLELGGVPWTRDRRNAIGAIVPAVDGGWLASVGDGVTRIRPDGTREKVATVMPDDGVARRMNDGKVDPHGRFWIGTIAWDKRPGGASLYRLDRGELTEVLHGVTISNGLAWTPGGDTMFYIDTPTQTVRRYAVGASGDLADEGVAVSIPKEQGSPDGMSIDDEGCLWVALWNGSAVQRYSPNGELLARVEVDAPQVSSCCFGGADRSTLFITTSQEDYSPEQSAAHPDAGRIFAVDAGVSGPLPDAYAL